MRDVPLTPYFTCAPQRYFLVICILQAIPQVSITNGVPTTAAPLAFVLAVDGLFTAIQDYNRHVSDRKVNVHSKVRKPAPAVTPL